MSDFLLRSNACPVCHGAMQKVIDLPRFPLTEMYEPYGPEFVDRGYYDQAFLFCERCVHGKLEAIVPPAELYGSEYRTRSSGSIGAMAALRNFSAFIEKTALEIDAVLDIGGNDASLVLRLPGAQKVVIDPNASGAGVEVVREFIEDVDLTAYKGLRKLIVSSHTLEHLADPRSFFKQAAAICMHGDWLAIQVPALEAMISDCRIDHIHHQHVNYFSRRSLSRLLAEYGFEVVRYDYDPMHWGALMVMCRKGRGDRDVKSSLVPSTIEKVMAVFLSRVGNTLILSESVGFGAALMLPVLAYWLPALKELEYIADNDQSKDGLRYINFNRPINCSYDLRDRRVVITAIGTKLACRALVIQAFDRGAREVIVPLAAM